jgi:sodium/potassium-transporting ATPase subunit alpha
VIRIGGRTVLGQIASFASNGEKVRTPLRIELDRFVLIITVIAIVLGIAFFFAAKYIVNYGWGDCITFGIGILVANVPEGLLGCITVSLAITANRLA